MRPCWILMRLCFFLIAFTSLLSGTLGIAADFEFAWDPPASEIQPRGYYLYYNAGASVIGNPDNAYRVYIQVTEPGFDPDHPSYSLEGLDDGVFYYFVVTADYSDYESAFSNEVIGKDSASFTSQMNAQGNESSGYGCFITAIR